MSDPEQRDPAAAATPRTVAASSNLRTEASLSQRAWSIGFSATATAVVLIVVAVALFGSHLHFNGSWQTHTAATPTQGPRGPVTLPGRGSIAAIGMDSPTDGWVLGSATTGGSDTGEFYHFDGSTWAPRQQINGVNIIGAADATITIFSSTDGWAFDGMGSVFHYDGTQWQSVAIDLAGGEHVSHFLMFKMISPTEGWAAAYIGGGAAGPGAINLLHYNQQRWTAEPALAALPGVDMGNLSINDISVTPEGDVWAIGSAPFTALPIDGRAPSVGLVLHRVAGVWQVASQFNQINANSMFNPRDIYMNGPNSGWLFGDTETYKVTPEGVGPPVTHALLMRYDGSTWTEVPTPLTINSNSDSFFHVVATGPDNIWVTLHSNSGTILPNGVYVQGLYLHYDGSTWSQVTPAPVVAQNTKLSMTSFALTPDGTFWSVGAMTLRHSDGTSSTGPFICSMRNNVWRASAFSANK